MLCIGSNDKRCVFLSQCFREKTVSVFELIEKISEEQFNSFKTMWTLLTWKILERIWMVEQSKYQKQMQEAEEVVVTDGVEEEDTEVAGEAEEEVEDTEKGAMVEEVWLAITFLADRLKFQ